MTTFRLRPLDLLRRGIGITALAVALVAAASAVGASPASAATPRCTDPDRAYTVIDASGVSCPYARRFAAEYQSRIAEVYSVPDYDGPPPSRVWAWRSVATGTGTYDGLYGTRTVWRRGAAKIRITSRGE